MTDAIRLSRDFALPLDVVTEATAIVATRGAGKSSTAAVVVEEAFAANIPTVVFDWTGVFWGLRSSADGTKPGLPVYVFGGPHGDLPLEPHAGQMMADLVVDSGHSFVLDLSDFTKTQARRFAADFLERLYDRKARSRTTLLLVIDEAHELAPQSPRGGFKGDAARLIGAMEQVVALGRSRGIGVVLITQRTQALNKAVLDLIETLLVMRMLSPRAVAAVKDWIAVKNEDDERGVLASLPELPTGTAWVWSPLRGILDRVVVRRIRTFDSYATPKPGETRVEPAERVELDLDALGEQMRASVERAKENDPSELRKRVRELEQQHEQAVDAIERPLRQEIERLEHELAVRPTAEEVRVEVPVLSDEERSLLAKLTAAAEISVGQWREDADRLEQLVARIGAVVSAPPLDIQPPARAPRPAPAPRIPDPPPAAPPPRRAPAATTAASSGISTSQQRVLDSLRWFELLGIPEPSRAAVAFIAGTRPTSGGFKNNLGALKNEKGVYDWEPLIGYPSPGRVALTDAGRSLASEPDLGLTNEALQQAVIAQLTSSQGAIVRALIARHPSDLDREELAAAVGVPSTSGGFKNNLGALRTLELIDYPGPGRVVALPVLFPEGA